MENTTKTYCEGCGDLFRYSKLKRKSYGVRVYLLCIDCQKIENDKFFVVNDDKYGYNFYSYECEK